MTMVLLMALAAGLQRASMADTILRGAHGAAVAGFYAAEAGVNRGMADSRDIFESYNVPTSTDFVAHSMTLGPRTVRYQLDVVPGYESGVETTVPGGRQFAGLNAIEYRYTNRATSEVHAGDAEVSLGTEFDVQYVPLFQFLAFFQGDLELTPAPNMTMHGPVHSNGNINFNSGNTLTIADLPPTIPTVHVSAHGTIRRGRAEASTCYGRVQVAKLADTNADGTLDLVDMPCSGGGTTEQTAAQLATWLGAVQEHAPRLTVPTPGALRSDYWDHADLRIVLDVSRPDDDGRFAVYVAERDGSVDATRTALLQIFMQQKPGRVFYNDVPGNGKDQQAACTASSSYCNANSYQPQFGSNARVFACAGSDLGAPPTTGCANGYIDNEALEGGTLLPVGALTARRGGFYNNREHAWVRMLNVNVHDLLAWNRARPAASRLLDPADTTQGGVVIFLGVEGDAGIPSTNPPTRYGVRVFGSSDLDFPAGMADPTGLTLASDRGFYLEGSYNAGTATHPKMPAAVLADTINVLSSNWSGAGSAQNDYQSRQQLANRPARSTVVNAAFLGGMDVTQPNDFSGGLENYPRFHESWNNSTLTYRGSFVSLGQPLYNNGRWCGNGAACNIYDPPTRNWDYDTDFQDAANLPPLTPRAITVQQILFAEDFR
ncbi:MAG: hypothetical protein U0807_12585 [Candidatus Binatia bacterium]